MEVVKIFSFFVCKKRIVLRKRVNPLSITLLIIFKVLIFTISPISGYTNHRNETIHVQAENNSIQVLSHEIMVDIETVDTIRVDEIIEIEYTGNASVSYLILIINQSHDNLIIKDKDERELIKEDIGSGFILVNLLTNLTSQGERLRLFYDLEFEPIKQRGRPPYYYMQFITGINYNTSYLLLTIRLPEKSFITQRKDLTPYTEGGNPGSPSGNRIPINWEINEGPITSKTYVVWFDEPFRNPVWVYVIVALITLVIGIGGTYWFMRRRVKQSVKKVGTIFLSDNQKLLLELINKNGGRIQQKQLAKKTGFTLSKVSRILRDLEENGLIEKEKWGREYRVIITELGEKVIE